MRAWGRILCGQDMKRFIFELWKVRVQSGLLSGRPEKDGKVLSFKGIPYAKIPPGRESEYYGAFHTGEIAYVFRNLDYINRTWTKSDYSLSDTMALYWTNFIKTGDPNGNNLPLWEPCLSKDSAVMLLGDELTMTEIPNVERMTFVGKRLSRWLENKDTKLLW